MYFAHKITYILPPGQEKIINTAVTAATPHPNLHTNNHVPRRKKNFHEKLSTHPPLCPPLRPASHPLQTAFWPFQKILCCRMQYIVTFCVIARRAFLSIANISLSTIIPHRGFLLNVFIEHPFRGRAVVPIFQLSHNLRQPATQNNNVPPQRPPRGAPLIYFWPFQK